MDDIELVPGNVSFLNEETKNLKRFEVSSSLESRGNGTEVRVVLKLFRRSGTYFISVFIPTFCMVIAAESTLFIDSDHFEASIMVALTANLVMYTLYGECEIIGHIFP